MFAVSAWFDDASEATVRDLWRLLADARIDDTLHAGPYRPHITVGVWHELPLAPASDQLLRLTSELSPLEVTFRALGVYPGHSADQDRRAGVYLTPTVTSELRELHEHVHLAMSGIASGVVERHVPGRWEPHCTLAPRPPVSVIARALELLIGADVLPLTATITRLGVIDTRAEVELRTLALA